MSLSILCDQSWRREVEHQATDQGTGKENLGIMEKTYGGVHIGPPLLPTDAPQKTWSSQ